MPLLKNDAQFFFFFNLRQSPKFIKKEESCLVKKKSKKKEEEVKKEEDQNTLKRTKQQAKKDKKHKNWSSVSHPRKIKKYPWEEGLFNHLTATILFFIFSPNWGDSILVGLKSCPFSFPSLKSSQPNTLEKYFISHFLFSLFHLLQNSPNQTNP